MFIPQPVVIYPKWLKQITQLNFNGLTSSKILFEQIGPPIYIAYQKCNRPFFFFVDARFSFISLSSIYGTHMRLTRDRKECAAYEVVKLFFFR